MTCRFLQTLSLQSLIAPATEAEFRSRYWEKEPLVVHRENPDYYDDLFTLQDFNDAITRSPDYVKMANAATNKNQSYRGAQARGLEGVLSDMRDGGTLVLDQLHNRDPNLGLLCRSLAAEIGHRFQTNLYLTPPNGKGFTPHYDNHDVFILQMLGSKSWKIEKNRRAFPGRDDNMGEEGRELIGDVSSFVLKQGDLIYIPRGFVHAAECGSEPSLHITLGVTGAYWSDVLTAAVKAAILRDNRLTEALPLNFNSLPRNVLVKRLRGVFREIADETFLQGVVDQYLDELVSTYPLDISGQVVDFFQPKPLALEDTVAPRRAIVYQMHPGEDTIRLNYGARSIVFPGFFREALEFALHGPAYAIRDIPGDLQDEERVVFTERLLQEGLVVRQTNG